MKPTELLDLCERIVVDQGVNFVVLVVPNRKPRGPRMRVFPGLFGRVIGSQPEGVIVSCATADVRAALTRNLERIEYDAVRIAERGDHELAAEWLEQYAKLQSRLAQELRAPPVYTHPRLTAEQLELAIAPASIPERSAIRVRSTSTPARDRRSR